MHYCLVICLVSSTDQIYHRAAKRRGDKFDRSMTRGKLLGNNALLFIFGRIAKAIPAYGLMMSVRLSVRPSVRPSTFWLTSAFKFVLGRINQYRLDTLHGDRP